GHHRVRPDQALPVLLRGPRDLEPAVLLPPVRAGPHEARGAVTLRVAVEHAAGAGHAALAELLRRPPLLAGLEILADPARPAGVAVDVVAEEDDAAVVVEHHPARLGVVDLLAPLARRVARDPGQAAAVAVAGGGVHAVVVEDRRGDADAVGVLVGGPHHPAV